MTRVLVTGANGFIGEATVEALVQAGFSVRAAVRATESLSTHFDGEVEVVAVGDIGPGTDWASVLADVDTIVHIAGRAHILRESSREPLEEFRNVNVLGTERLAREAVISGVRRIIYLSTIGVHGRVTRTAPFTEEHHPSPHNDYALSKWEAEQALKNVADESRVEIVVLRSPLAYGPKVKANFLKIMKAVDMHIPLPMGSVQNSRSLIYVRNLADSIVTCVDSPAAAEQTFLVSDGEDISTPELIRYIADALRQTPILLPFPPQLLRWVGRATGKWPMVESLLDSLVVDSSKIRRMLDWRAPYGMKHGMEETANWFKSAKTLRRG
jgi:nucleoside-diphosphate-sugar epimerase